MIRLHLLSSKIKNRVSEQVGAGTYREIDCQEMGTKDEVSVKV